MKIIKETRLYEMASIGILDGGYTVRVYGNEGSIPHFHITKGRGSSPSEECCICIKEPKYFEHDSLKTNNRRIKDLRLTDGLKQNLINMLKEPAGNKSLDINKWQLIILMWNVQNPGDYRQVDDNLEMPDYTKLD